MVSISCVARDATLCSATHARLSSSWRTNAACLQQAQHTQTGDRIQSSIIFRIALVMFVCSRAGRQRDRACDARLLCHMDQCR